MTMETKQILGFNFYFHRKKARKSQFNISYDLNMSQRTISRIENGEENLKLSTLNVIVKNFNIPVYYLFLPKRVTFRELFNNPILCGEVIQILYMFYLTERLKNGNPKDIIYGIEMKDDDEIFRIDDISEDKSFVENLADMCNRWQIPMEHFPAVIRDAMIEEQMKRTDERFKV